MNDDLAISFGFGKYVDYEADSFDRNAISRPFACSVQRKRFASPRPT